MSCRGPWSVTAAVALPAAFFACALAGGPTSAIDATVASHAAAMRHASPLLMQSALLLTWLGGAAITLPLAAMGAFWLIRHGEAQRSVLLLITVVAARLSVDGLKLYFARMRPAFDTELVHVHGLSFPSGHAANSLVTYGLIALFLAKKQFRGVAMTAALALAFLVGSTRVLIGVHWFSDVVGGWAAGFAAILLAVTANRQLTSQE